MIDIKMLTKQPEVSHAPTVKPPASGRTRLLALVRAESRPVYADRTASPATLHTGDVDWFFENISCQSACPAHTDVARYIAHLAGGDPAEAYKINKEDNVFPGILGRVCARPCESACRRGRIDEPIAICALKRGASDLLTEDERARLPERPARLYEETIGIVGAGPAGLTAAADLVRRGYGVVVYDALPRAGGMLVAGIPAFRLPREVVRAEVDDYFAALGVEFRLGVRVGENEKVTLQALREEHTAVYLAAGTQAPRRLKIPGEDTPGVIPGLAFMQALNLPEAPVPAVIEKAEFFDTEGAIDLQGLDVVVIGAGYTAMDCARSAVRLGAASVSVLYRRGPREMSADAQEVAEAQREGIVFHYHVTPQEIIVDHDGHASGLILRKTDKPIVEIIDFKGDIIITALGQEAATAWMPGEESGIPRNEQTGRLSVTNETFATPVPGLFAGGDFTAGGRNIISAVADGHKAAVAIERYLRGKRAKKTGEKVPVEATMKIEARFTPVTHLAEVPIHQQIITGRITNWSRMRERQRTHSTGEALLRIEAKPPANWTEQTMQRRRVEGDTYESKSREQLPMIGLQGRTMNTEVETGFTARGVHEEASRCLQCQMNIFLEGNMCILCNTCVDVCPTGVIKMIPFNRIESIDNEAGFAALATAREWTHGAAMALDEDLCVRCGLCVQFCPTQCITMQHFQPVTVPAAGTLVCD